MRYKITLIMLLLCVLMNTSCKSRKKHTTSQPTYENGWEVVSDTIVVEVN